ncbi:MAG: hypothetical protein RLZZ84_126 [Pseudomonadota bacterium]|jgi:hypothetical protein
MAFSPRTGRLSTLAAAYVIARRDFTAILFSRSFFFFLLGPLFPMLVGGLAGGIGQQVQDHNGRPELGVAMSAGDVAAITAAHRRLVPQLGAALPELVIVQQLAPGTPFDPAQAMQADRANLAAIVTGSLDHPVLTGPEDRIADWQGRVALLAAEARDAHPAALPTVRLSGIATSTADQAQSRLITAQLGQTVLFLLTMLLAGMVLSNLVEEKGNKIIEVLAAAISMDAVFFGKLFAMLAVSWVGISVWALAGGALWFTAGHSLAGFPGPWGDLFLTGLFAAGVDLSGDRIAGLDRARSANAVDAGHDAAAADLLLRHLRHLAARHGGGIHRDGHAVKFALRNAGPRGAATRTLAPCRGDRVATGVRGGAGARRRGAVSQAGDAKWPHWRPRWWPRWWPR